MQEPIFQLADGSVHAVQNVCLTTMATQPRPARAADLVVHPMTLDNGQVYIDLAGGE